MLWFAVAMLYVLGCTLKWVFKASRYIWRHAGDGISLGGKDIIQPASKRDLIMLLFFCSAGGAICILPFILEYFMVAA